MLCVFLILHIFYCHIHYIWLDWNGFKICSINFLSIKCYFYFNINCINLYLGNLYGRILFIFAFFSHWCSILFWRKKLTHWFWPSHSLVKRLGIQKKCQKKNLQNPIGGIARYRKKPLLMKREESVREGFKKRNYIEEFSVPTSWPRSVGVIFHYTGVYD